MSSTDRLKAQQRTIVTRHNKPNDIKGATQVVTTLGCVVLLWVIALNSVGVSAVVAAAAMLLLIPFNVRVFGLMHESGHGSLFRTPWMNRASGFVMGVIAGMPQYVWSQHHNYHHAHNGNWDKYRGPYTTPSVDEYAAMSAGQQRLYRIKCHIATAPLVGFIYLIFNPRFTWMKGSIGFFLHVVRNKLSHPDLSMRQHAATYRTRYWASRREYRHMTWNNVVLLTLWALMCWRFGAGPFFAIYLVTLSIAGAVGIILFTVQHNFEHAYASNAGDWDYTTGALQGTSYLTLPPWLNWFTVDMGYHHIHHLSARIPNYCLANCHKEYEHLFDDVTRIRLMDFYGALKCILWDRRTQRIITVREYLAAGVSGSSPEQSHRGPA